LCAQQQIAGQLPKQGTRHQFIDQWQSVTIIETKKFSCNMKDNKVAEEGVL
jgi:hypothetical protein